MAASALSGPQFVYGNMAALTAAVFGTAVPDPNQDAGPNGMYQGYGILDVRYVFQKDQVTGRTGRVPAHFAGPFLRSVSQIPAALGAALIAPLAHVVSGTAMTLAAAATGITRNIPIIPYSADINGGAVATAAIALDFGFAFGNCTAASKTIVVADSTNFWPGMPLVIGAALTSTTPLLTNVVSITDATHIVVADAVGNTNTVAPIGTGNFWGPTENSAAIYPTPTAALPWLAGGPGLFLDSRQAVTRVVSITGVAAGSGGTFTVAGWDIYGQPMTQLITLAAGINTVYSTKCFKYIKSVTPNFTDANNVSVGTGDVFGFNYRTDIWEDSEVAWAGTSMTSSTGFLAPDTTTPATNATGDVRGVIQTGAGGGGSGIGSTASNGTVSSLAMSGNRLSMMSWMPTLRSIIATPANPVPYYGVTQV